MTDAEGQQPDTERLQKQHYDQIASEYAAHYGDAWSEKYRRRFINEPMLENVDLNGKIVIDALCGSGETTGFLLEKGAQVTGVDISQNELDHFHERFPDCSVKCTSILSTGLAEDSCDCVVVVGGLHHVHPNVTEAVDEIYRILKPGGHFCFAEPHKDSFPDRIRQIWYRRDTLFEDNEASVDLDFLKNAYSQKFEFIRERYIGNVAYLLVLNSMVFRIPLRLKRYYSSLLMKMESLIGIIQGKLLSCMVVCQWKKK